MRRLYTKLVVTAFLIVSGLQLLAQKPLNQTQQDSVQKLRNMIESISEKDIVSKIDTLLFSKVEDNFYQAKDNAAGYMEILMPFDFETSKDMYTKKLFSSKMETLEQKKFKHNGQSIFRIKQLAEKNKEQLISITYIKEFENASVVLFGYYKKKFEKFYLKPINDAALSATVIYK